MFSDTHNLSSSSILSLFLVDLIFPFRKVVYVKGLSHWTKSYLQFEKHTFGHLHDHGLACLSSQVSFFSYIKKWHTIKSNFKTACLVFYIGHLIGDESNRSNLWLAQERVVANIWVTPQSVQFIIPNGYGLKCTTALRCKWFYKMDIPFGKQLDLRRSNVSPCSLDKMCFMHYHQQQQWVIIIFAEWNSPLFLAYIQSSFCVSYFIKKHYMYPVAKSKNGGVVPNLPFSWLTYLIKATSCRLL